jgi:CRISPR-associated protein Csx3
VSTYQARMVGERQGVVYVEVGFGDPAQNDRIVPDAIAAIQALGLRGGTGIHFNGPMSMPAAMAAAHAVGHLFQYVACFDPKLNAYVVAIAHGAEYRPGQLLAAEPAGI